MKKYAFFLSTLVIAASCGGNSNNNVADAGPTDAQQSSSMNQSDDCNTLTPGEQNFANQITDLNYKTVFCAHFSAQQRQQAMQMAGKTDTSGNTMTADQAVQQVMGTGGAMTPPNQTTPKPAGGCPVK